MSYPHMARLSAPRTETARCCVSCCPADGRHDPLNCPIMAPFRGRERSCFPSCPRSEFWKPWRTCQANHHRQQGKGHTVGPPWKYHNRHHRQIQRNTSLSLPPLTQSIALEENGKQSTRRGHTRSSFNKKAPIPYLQHLGQVHLSQWSTNQEETLKTSPVRFPKASSVTLENCGNACWPHASGTTL